MEAGASLPKQQTIVVPSFYLPSKEVKRGYSLFPPVEKELSPFVSVPVSYQWQITSIYLQFLAELEIGEYEGINEATARIGIVGKLLRDGQLVWIEEIERDVPIVGEPNVVNAFCALRPYLAEDFTNPVVVSPANRLVLAIEGSAFVEQPGHVPPYEPKLNSANLYLGPQEGQPYLGGGWTSPGVIHYSLYGD